MEITIKDDFIKLGQALKLAGLVDSGVDAKFVIQDGQVKVNGEVDTKTWKKTLCRRYIWVWRNSGNCKIMIVTKIELSNFKNYRFS